MIDELILICLGLSLPLGSGMQTAFSFDVSKAFPLVSAIAIVRAIQRRPVQGYPTVLWAFLIFIAAHSVVVYTLVAPQDFSFTSLGFVTLGGGFVRETESVGIQVVRVFFFALTGWAFSTLWSPRGGIWFSCSCFAGLVLTVLLGGYTTKDFLYAGYEERISGGFLDANAFGLTALCCLCLLVMNLAVTTSSRVRIFSLIAIPVCGLFLAMSGSRGSFVGVLFALVTLIRGRNKTKVIVVTVFAAGIVFMLLTHFFPTSTETVAARVSPTRLVEDNGAGRTYIWADYLRHINDYWLLGVGSHRSISVIQQDYTERAAICHNTFLTVFVEYGVFGLILFVGALLNIARQVWRLAPGMRQSCAALLVGWIGQAMFLDSLSLRDTWVILGVCSALGSLSSRSILSYRTQTIYKGTVSRRWSVSTPSRPSAVRAFITMGG